MTCVLNWIIQIVLKVVTMNLVMLKIIHMMQNDSKIVPPLMTNASMVAQGLVFFCAMDVKTLPQHCSYMGDLRSLYLL